MMNVKNDPTDVIGIRKVNAVEKEDLNHDSKPEKDVVLASQVCRWRMEYFLMMV